MRTLAVKLQHGRAAADAGQVPEHRMFFAPVENRRAAHAAAHRACAAVNLGQHPARNHSAFNQVCNFLHMQRTYKGRLVVFIAQHALHIGDQRQPVRAERYCNSLL